MIQPVQSGKIDCQAVILAGGLGTRMRPVTETIPKPMIPVNGKPFLQHQLELLQKNGVERVLLLVSYLGEQIEQYFKHGDSMHMKISYSYESSPLGTGGALKNASAKLEEKFLLLNGDTFLDVDYAAVIKDFQRHQPQALIVARKSTDMPVPNNLAVTADGQVTAYQKRNPENMTCTDAGAIVLSRKVLDDIAPAQVCSLEEQIFPRLIERGEMRAWVTAEPFFDMGSPVGLQALSEKLA
jgi:N-acetyl-alpha-D-muramate 1-phosphate uridylyltransferase